jgi:gluconolactonase
MSAHKPWLVPLLVFAACSGSGSETTGSTGDTGSTGTTGAATTGTASTGPTPTTGATGTSGDDTTAAPTTGTPDTTASTDDPTTGGTTMDATTGAVDPPMTFEEIVDGELELISEGHNFTEGPIWHPDGFLLYSDIPANTIFRWQEGGQGEAFITPSGNSNGLDLDAMGLLIAAEHGPRRLSRRVLGEDAQTIVDQFEGQKLNSPNDLIIRSDGTIYFTDPPYGIQPQDQELAFQGVFRVDPRGQISLIADDFDRPNGIALSPDETILYVADTATEQVRKFAVQPGGEVTGGEVFVDLQSDLQGNPDGMAVDVFGDLFVTGGGGVRVVTPAGALLGTIMVPEQVTNCTFGDPDGMALFLTAQSRVYRIRLKVKGVGLP